MEHLIPRAGGAAILVDPIVHIHNQLETAKYLAVASCTILVYDWITNFHREVAYVWTRPWGFGRVTYHLNRAWSITTLWTCLPIILFTHNLEYWMCKRTITFYAYSMVVQYFIACTIMLVRCWALYNRRWVLWLLSASLMCVLAITLVFAKLLTDDVVYVTNPFPDIISGCLVLLPSYIWAVYISPMVYELLVFSLTVWKVWRMRRDAGTTALTLKLAENAALYFIALIGISLFTCLGGTNPEMKAAANVSGIYPAMISVVGSQIIISLYEFGTKEGQQRTAGRPTTGAAATDGQFKVPLSTSSGTGSATPFNSTMRP